MDDNGYDISDYEDVDPDVWRSRIWSGSSQACMNGASRS